MLTRVVVLNRILSGKTASRFCVFSPPFHALDPSKHIVMTHNPHNSRSVRRGAPVGRLHFRRGAARADVEQGVREEHRGDRGCAPEGEIQAGERVRLGVLPRRADDGARVGQAGSAGLPQRAGSHPAQAGVQHLREGVQVHLGQGAAHEARGRLQGLPVRQLQHLPRAVRQLLQQPPLEPRTALQPLEQPAHHRVQEPHGAVPRRLPPAPARHPLAQQRPAREQQPREQTHEGLALTLQIKQIKHPWTTSPSAGPSTTRRCSRPAPRRPRRPTRSGRTPRPPRSPTPSSPKSGPSRNSTSATSRSSPSTRPGVPSCCSSRTKPGTPAPTTTSTTSSSPSSTPSTSRPPRSRLTTSPPSSSARKASSSSASSARRPRRRGCGSASPKTASPSPSPTPPREPITCIACPIPRRRQHYQRSNMIGQAKYFQVKEDGNQVYYCSKCAVQLASIGVKVQEISKQEKSGQNSMQKESDLNKFLEGLEEQRLMYFNEFLLSSQLRIDQWFKEQQVLVQQQCDQIVRVVRSKQQQVLLELMEEKNKLFTRIKQYKSELLQYQSDIDNIKNDINLNYQQVVNSIELKTFRDIMSYYQQRLNSVQTFMSRLKKEKYNLKYFMNGSSILEVLEQLLVVNSGIEDHYLIDTITKQIKTQPSECVIANKLYISFDDKEGFQNQNRIEEHEHENESSLSESPKNVEIKHPTFRQLFENQDRQNDKVYQIEQLDIQCEE